jgi:hypothetical protein
LWHSVHPEGAPYEEGAQERFQAVAGAVGSAPKEGAEVPFRAVARAAPPQVCHVARQRGRGSGGSCGPPLWPVAPSHLDGRGDLRLVDQVVGVAE